jgi:hypothetical protein
MISSVQVKTSRYVQGGQTEVGAIGLEWWNKFNFPKDGSDLIYIVEQRFEGRLDLIANAFYNDPKLFWFIGQYNDILDPFAEIVVNRQLVIPTLERVQLLMNNRLGGIASTRSSESILAPVII